MDDRHPVAELSPLTPRRFAVLVHTFLAEMHRNREPRLTDEGWLRYWYQVNQQDFDRLMKETLAVLRDTEWEH